MESRVSTLPMPLPSFIILNIRDREMAQYLNTLDALVENLNSVPRSHIVVYNCL